MWKEDRLTAGSRAEELTGSTSGFYGLRGRASAHPIQCLLHHSYLKKKSEQSAVVMTSGLT